MFFSKKQKDPEIKFVPMVKGLKELSPVLPARELLPKWWSDIKFNEKVKLIDNYPATVGTIKRCPGIIDFLNYGWIIPMWCDLYVNIKKNENISFEFSDKIYSASIHAQDQFLNLTPNHIREKYNWVLKLHSPWIVQTSPGYSLYEVNPFYHFNKEFDIATGMTDSDIYFSVNPFLLFKAEGEFVIKQGTPISIIIPIKREKIQGTVEDYNEERWQDLDEKSKRIALSKFSPIFSYKKLQIKNRKCPFS